MEKNLATENVTWDLSNMYRDIDDPQIDNDIESLALLCKQFHTDYKNNLAQKLAGAIADYSQITMLGGKVMVYLFLRQSLDVTNSNIKAKISEAEQKINAIQGQYVTFFMLELVALDETVIQDLAQKNEIVKKHLPWILHQRVFKPHVLDEPVEAALVKRSAFGVNAWSEFFDECEADLQFEYHGENKILTQMLDALGNEKDAAKRAEILQIINKGFSGYFSKYSAQTLHVTVGEMAVEIKERDYKHPMAAQNKSNNIPDAVVDALHTVVLEVVAPLAQRYYKLKAVLLGLPCLAWSDRNAPLPFSDTHKVPFNEAMQLVQAAYESFSPTLASIIAGFVAEKKIDAPAVKGKRSGAFNYSLVLPDNQPQSFTFLNYLGSNRDVMTLAHELGHGVHGILAANAQGPLMFHAPIAYCETASVFGEMITFNFLQDQLRQKNNTLGLLALLTGKIEDMLNTIVRQIGFSNFERRIHGMDATYTTWHEPKKLSVPQLNQIWLETLHQMYGKDGDVFTYENTEYLWSYISHFHRPFYVYGYAFGELLTQSLYAKREQFGQRFEPLYLDLLKSGSTKNVVELLQPFGLNPTDKNFWAAGINVSLEAMIEEVETLAKNIKPILS